MRPHRQRRVRGDASRPAAASMPRRSSARRARGDRAAALDRYRGAHQRACRLRAGAAPRHHPRRTDAPGRARAARGRQERRRRHRRLRARDRYRVDRPEIHPARIAARARRQRAGAALISRSSPRRARASSASKRLLRWTHATRGPIGPAVFIPVAEQMGLMDTLGAFVLRRALNEAKRWPDLYVAVNLSPLQVRDRVHRRVWCARRWPRAACRRRG